MTTEPANPARRARDFGIPFEGTPGPLNALTDVPGIHVGFSTVREETPRPGRRLPVRTGVTAILPHAAAAEPIPVFAGIHRFNGNGEMTGSHWIEDGGYFLGPVLITNTHSVGIAHHGAVRWMLDRYASTYEGDDALWILPVVAETYDGRLNDINGQHVTLDHVLQALDGAAAGPVAEGNVGGGTGMIAYGFKGGTGTASRRITIGGSPYMLGALVQANHGQRDWLTIAGRAIGRQLSQPDPDLAERGSIIVVLATDLPLGPHQLQKLARRGAIGIGRNGTIGGNSSGDIFLAFSTANQHPMRHKAGPMLTMTMINDDALDPVYQAAVQAIEEAVLNAMAAAQTTGGTPYDRCLIEALDMEAVARLLAAS
ncbi:aminopeptidase [Xaviernesmea oryzae]|uniref:Aminopeptidase n=1 Tax=Xaviernesmea oryzae TaxID=464029 RepID=A0A1Q9B1E5_9HYPH|nr:P1 family peptidase [Xaviernesmea oryzae]OLP61833.1 aminopeptidase [Xaviernesmea oryzae]SEL76044.1 L-aminopeptidase/D-esterase [Xaviernesmea oryzae]